MIEPAKAVGFLDGEIQDSLCHVGTRYLGGHDQLTKPEKADSIVLTTFTMVEEPDYRNPVTFHAVFMTMRNLIREKGIANAVIERSVLVKKAANRTTAYDAEIAIAILLLNGILADEKGLIRFASGREAYGSPGDQANVTRRQPAQTPIRRPVR